MQSQAIEVIKSCNDPHRILEIRSGLAAEIQKLTLKLYEHRRAALIPKGKEFTELDRKVHMDADTAVIESELNFLIKLDELLAEKARLLASPGR